MECASPTSAPVKGGRFRRLTALGQSARERMKKTRENMQRSLSASKFSLLQRLGRAKATQENEEFKQLHDKFTSSNELQDEILRFSRAKRFIDLTTRLSDEGSGLARALANFGRMRGEELGEPFMQIGKAHLEIEEMRKSTYSLSLGDDFVSSMSTFMEKDVASIESLERDYQRSKLDFDLATQKALETEAKKEVDSVRLFSSQEAAAKAEAEYKEKADMLLCALRDAEEKRDIVFAQGCTAFYRSLEKFFQSADSKLRTCETELSKIEDVATEKERALIVEQDRRQEERSKNLEEQSLTRFCGLHVKLLESGKDVNGKVVPFRLLHAAMKVSLELPLFPADAEALALSLVKALSFPPVTPSDSENLSFSGVSALLRPLKTFLKEEVDQTTDEKALFRGKSPFSRLLTATAKIVGDSYVRRVVGPVVRDVLEKGIELEVDPDKVAVAADVETSLASLLEMASSLLSAILFSLPSIPSLFREVSHFTAAIVGDRFPEHRYSAVAGIFFLRFVCPAVYMPEAWGITNIAPTQGVRRTLLLLAKVLQNAANGVVFGAKERCLESMNTFIHQKEKEMQEFFQDLSSIPSVASPQSAVQAPSDNDWAVLHSFFFQNLEAVVQDLVTTKDKSLAVAIATEVARLGPAPAAPKLTNDAQSAVLSFEADDSLSIDEPKSGDATFENVLSSAAREEADASIADISMTAEARRTSSEIAAEIPATAATANPENRANQEPLTSNAESQHSIATPEAFTDSKVHLMTESDNAIEE